MVIDPSQPDQERDLEQLYMNFAQPNSLTIKQCLILAIQVAREGSFGLGGWQGERAGESCEGKARKFHRGSLMVILMGRTRLISSYVCEKDDLRSDFRA